MSPMNRTSPITRRHLCYPCSHRAFKNDLVISRPCNLVWSRDIAETLQNCGLVCWQKKKLATVHHRWQRRISEVIFWTDKVRNAAVRRRTAQELLESVITRWRLRCFGHYTDLAQITEQWNGYHLKSRKTTATSEWFIVCCGVFGPWHSFQ